MDEHGLSGICMVFDGFGLMDLDRYMVMDEWIVGYMDLDKRWLGLTRSLIYRISIYGSLSAQASSPLTLIYAQ